MSLTGSSSSPWAGTRFDQVGIVVNSLRIVRATMAQVFELAPSREETYRYEELQFQGKRVSTAVDVLLYDFFGTELEFMSPHDGQNVWFEQLRTTGPGLHHIRLAVPTHAGKNERLLRAGIDRAQHGRSVRGGDVEYSYFDARAQLGLFLELINIL